MYNNRPELGILREMGYKWNNPWDVVSIFESKVAEFSGSKYAVATDCCSHAIFLVLKYLNKPQKLKIPSRTYVSVPQQILHAGYEVEFADVAWSGIYRLSPLNVWDGAGRWARGMYVGGNSFQTLSFQIKKKLPIGRGGVILCDDPEAYEWFKRARYDGRDLSLNHADDRITIHGWHMYMTPEDAARGVILMDKILNDGVDTHNHESYVDLRLHPIFKNL